MRALLVALALALPVTAEAQSRLEVEDGVDRYMLGVFDALQPRSTAEGRSHCGWVGFDAAGELAATPASAGDAESCTPAAPPAGFTAVARYRTLGNFKNRPRGEVPATADLTQAIQTETETYIASPMGRVWLALPFESVVYQLCTAGCVPADPAAHECQDAIPAYQYPLAQLRKLDALPRQPC